jgi:tetratricopeptide (TPR) repeat protein
LTAIEIAERAAYLADVDPRRVVPVAVDALRVATKERDQKAAAIAERAWGHSLVQCGQLDSAIRHLRRAIVRAHQAESPVLVGEARMRLAYALVMRGRPAIGVREINSALAELDGEAHTRALAQRGAIYLETGQLDEALIDLDIAIPELRRAADGVQLARALGNRGVVLAELHDFVPAIRDFQESEQLCRKLGRGIGVGIIEQNLGFVEILRGDVPAALDYLTRAERTLSANGGQLAALLQDHGELLLSVGLTSEAREVANRAIVASRREQRTLKVPELQLMLSQIAYLDGDWPESVEQAAGALRGFSRQRRQSWAALGRLSLVRAKLAVGSGRDIDRRTVESMVDTLAASGWPTAVTEARLVAARVCFAQGRTTAAYGHLRSASDARRRGPAALRSRGWYAESLLRHHLGDRRRATSAARSGLRILDEHAASLGAADLRVHSAVYRKELSELGLRTAVDTGRPAGVFEWAERGRASQLHHRQVLPADDPVLAEMLTQLRAVAGEIQQADVGHTRSSIVQRQVSLERRIRDHTRLRPGESHERLTGPVSPARLGAALGDRALVEFVQLDETLFALSLVDGKLRLHTLGPAGRVTDLIERVPFALHRLARRESAAGSLASAEALLADAAARLDSALLGPLAVIEDRPLIVVPTGVLHSMPWSILPSCDGRAVTVSPSATLWYKANTHADSSTDDILVAAGPGLTGATKEADVVAAIHGITPMIGDMATVGAVLTAMATAGTAHLAAHGSLVTDNPLFSTLTLSDGPLFAYDLERLARVPNTVVLASCDSGRSVVCVGDELLGLSATFIARGTAQLVASVLPVPDAETAPLMAALHSGIAAGDPAPVALAQAQQGLRDQGYAELAAAAGFVCIGT